MLSLNDEKEIVRQYWIDWLRVFAMILIFFFHCARAFDHLPWHLKNNELNIGFTIFVILIASFIMPLFFVLSGISTYYSLEVRTQKEFVKERFKRLFIPWIFCVFTILSLHVYYEARFGSTYLPSYSGSYFEFLLLKYYSLGLYGIGGYLPISYGIYLWYLLVLFIFSLITLKFLIFCGLEKNKEKINKFAIFLNKPGKLFLLIIPVIIFELIGVLLIPRLDFGGWNILPYLCFFIYGYLSAINPKFKEAIQKNGIYSFIVALISSIIILISFFSLTHDSLLFDIIFIIFWPLNCFCWLISILSYASKNLNKNNKSLKSLNEILLPFYIVHQTIIIVIAFYIISFEANIFIKYLLLVVIAFSLTIGSTILIKRINILRFLFGMHFKEKDDKAAIS